VILGFPDAEPNGKLLRGRYVCIDSPLAGFYLNMVLSANPDSTAASIAGAELCSAITINNAIRALRYSCPKQFLNPTPGS
jgi:hypothetical protein